MIVETKDLSFTYLGFSKPALQGVTLQVPPRTITALVGSVASGKTTLLLTLNGLIPEFLPGSLEGQISVDGVDVRKVEAVKMAEHLGLVFDDPTLQVVGLTVEEDVAFGPGNLGLTSEQVRLRVAEALHKARLDGFEKRNPRRMSGGEQQRLAIAGILAMRPRLVAMDEPIAMLDPIGKDMVLQSVREMRDEYGLSVLLSESGTDIEAVCEFVDRVELMSNGTIVARGKPGEVFSNQKLIEELRVKAPEVTRLSWALGLKTPEGLVPTTLAEAQTALRPLLAGKKLSSVLRASDTSVAAGTGKAIIRVHQCCHTYPSSPPVDALTNVDLTINEGEMVAIVGQNGSGKTTLAFHLVGVLKPTNPDAVVEVDGLDVIKADTRQVIEHANYVFQNPSNQLFCASFGEEVRYGPVHLGLPPDEVERRTHYALGLVGMDHLDKEDTVGISRSGESLLSLASVLSMDPKVLVVDEPTSGLDWQSGNKVMQILSELNRQGKTILIISHDMELVARYCRRVIVFKDGQVLTDGTPRQVFSQPALLASTFLQPPQTTRLAQSLSEFGLPPDVLTVEELAGLIQQA